MDERYKKRYIMVKTIKVEMPTNKIKPINKTEHTKKTYSEYNVNNPCIRGWYHCLDKNNFKTDYKIIIVD